MHKSNHKCHNCIEKIYIKIFIYFFKTDITALYF